jgi:penicillin-binding protein 1A
MRWLYYSFLALFSIGMLGLMAGIALAIYAISYFGKDIPDYSMLKTYDPPVITRIYAGDGRLMEEYAQEKRVFVPIDSIPDLVKHAYISAEDKNFYHHQGIDYTAIARTIIVNLKHPGRRPKGASTITQQVAKNFILGNEVSYKRKIREAILAYRIERAMSKDKILELYLNEIFLGQRSYGVAAAAQTYFNKSLEDLSIEEAAYLAILPKAPSNYHPVRDHDAAVERRNWVIDRMREDGYITETEAVIATAKPLQMAKRIEAQSVEAPYYAEEVRKELQERYGDDALYKGGLAVRTSADPRFQQIAQKALRAGLMAFDHRKGWRGPLTHWDDTSDYTQKLINVARPGAMLDEWRIAMALDAKTVVVADDRKLKLSDDDVKWTESAPLKAGDVVMIEEQEKINDKTKAKEKNIVLRQIPKVNGALVAMDPHTGRVLAMQGGWSYNESSFNRATQAKRQPGSSFKPFVYLNALDHGFTPATLILDEPVVLDQGPGMPKWRPTNYHNDFYGPTPLRIGVEKSRNLMTVRLAAFLGMDSVAAYAKKFGIVDDMPHYLSSALGSVETTVLRMTTAYAQLVNGGKKITPTLIDRIQDRRGKTIFSHDTRICSSCGPLLQWEQQETPIVPDNREQLDNPLSIYQMVSILEGVAERGTAAKLKEMNRPLAGKTGTTNDSRDTWFIGFSPDLVVGVYIGYDDPKPLGKKETGASVAVPVFEDFMKDALKDAPILPFRVPPGIRQVQINAETGTRARPGDKRVIWEAFVAGTEPTDKSYILTDSGIAPVGGFRRDSALPADGVDTEVDNDDNTAGPPAPYDDNNSAARDVTPSLPPTVPTSSGDMTGTGGLY